MRSLRIVGLVLATLFFAEVAFSESEDTSVACPVTKPNRKITPEGQVTSVLKAERPWSPTGVAVSGHDIYVLEYTNANGPATEGWRPRVRKLAKDNTVTTLLLHLP